MVSQPGPPRIGQTTIRPTIPQTLVRTTAPTMRPLTTIRGQTTIVQTHANQVPALHPVSGTILSNSGAQVNKFKPSISLFLPNVVYCLFFILMNYFTNNF